jgi:hypothetical protein
MVPHARVGRASGSLRNPDDEERDGHVLAGERNDRERVEKLVVTEDPRQWIWFLHPVDNSTRGVGEATGGEEDDSGDSFAVHELR